MRNSLIAIVIVAIAGVAGWHYLGQDVPARPDTATPVPASNATAEREHTLPPESEATSQEGAAVSLLHPGMSQQELADAKRREILAQAAEARFQETVNQDNLRPESVSPQVRELFSSFKLEPVFDLDATEPGTINGMRIATLRPSNPLARAGFAVGDHITRINGEALHDPAQIAHLVTTIKDQIEICTDSGTREQCRTVMLNQ